MNENVETGYTPADIEFRSFNKLARLNREIVITEKIDGTNAQILLIPACDQGLNNPNVVFRNGETAMFVGSRNKWITPGKSTDNYGFAGWCRENALELLKLGHGRHFGEWWGNGIQRNYGLKEKRFSLFNVARWEDDNSPCGGIVDVETKLNRVRCCRVVPTLWRGLMSTGAIEEALRGLAYSGSVAAPGFMDPEGVVIYHTAANSCFKVTLKNDESPKSLTNQDVGVNLLPT